MQTRRQQSLYSRSNSIINYLVLKFFFFFFAFYLIFYLLFLILNSEGYYLLLGVFPGDKEIGFIHVTCCHLHLLHSVLPGPTLVNKLLPRHHKAVLDDLDSEYLITTYSSTSLLL